MQSTVEPIAGDDTPTEDEGSEAQATGSIASKVKLHITVPADEFEKAIDAAFKKLAREVRIPGFRPGKAPRRLLENRLGTEVAREQALQDALPQYYVDAVQEHDVDVIAPPEIEIVAGQDDGDVEFDAVVEIRPQVRLVGYDELRIELPFAPITDDDVDQQVDQLRERFADLTDSEFPLVDDAYATIDIAGTVDGEAVEGLTATDFLYRVGSGMVVDELDDQLRGTKPGAILEFATTLPERFGELAGDDAKFRVIVKEAKQKVLPEVTDEWVGEASEFDTVDELRADIRKRLELRRTLQAQMACTRQGDRGRGRSRADRGAAHPGRRRDAPAYRRPRAPFVTPGRHARAVPRRYRPGAAGVRRRGESRCGPGRARRPRAARGRRPGADHRERRGARRRGPSDRRTGRQKPEKVRRDLERGGALETVRSDVARGKALEFLVEHATVVDEDGNTIDMTIPESESLTESDVPEADGAHDAHDHHEHDHAHEHEHEHEESEA